jgi:hypothetical protein
LRRMGKVFAQSKQTRMINLTKFGGARSQLTCAG